MIDDRIILQCIHFNNKILLNEQMILHDINVKELIENYLNNYLEVKFIYIDDNEMKLTPLGKAYAFD